MSKWLCVAVLLATPLLFAQNDYFDGVNRTLLEVDFGSYEPNTDSDVFDFFEDTITFDREDMDGASLQFKILYQLNNHINVGGSFSGFRETQVTEDRFYVLENGDSIFQENSLKHGTLAANLQWLPFGSGETFGSRGWAPRFFVPYLGVGLGVRDWELAQEGLFVDDSDPNDPIVFESLFKDEGTAFVVRFEAGFRIRLHKSLDLNCLYQSDHSESELEGSFEGFGDLDLGSRSAYVGVVVRL